MKKYLLYLNFLFVLNGFSQELTIPTYTQYLGENNAVISPAYLGIGDHIKIRLNGLTQWVGIKDAPDNQSLSVNARLGQKSGIGAFVYNDKNGNTFQKGAKISFAHHLILDYNNDKYLSFGMSLVTNRFEIDINKFNTELTPDPDVRDNRELGNINVDVGFLYRQKNVDIALNVFNIVNKNTDIFTKFEPGRLRSYSLYGATVLKRNSSNFEYEPSANIQYFEGDHRTVSDINFKIRKLDFESYYWAGLSYRFINDQAFKPLNIGPMAGFKKNNFYFAYSYQITTNKFISYNSGTHMVTIGYDIFQNISNCPCAQKFTKQENKYKPIIN
jgi:type IX secretion system PorP/SprF family membrane protein